MIQWDVFMGKKTLVAWYGVLTGFHSWLVYFMEHLTKSGWGIPISGKIMRYPISRLVYGKSQSISGWGKMGTPMTKWKPPYIHELIHVSIACREQRIWYIHRIFGGLIWVVMVVDWDLVGVICPWNYPLLYIGYIYIGSWGLGNDEFEDVGPYHPERLRFWRCNRIIVR